MNKFEDLGLPETHMDLELSEGMIAMHASSNDNTLLDRHKYHCSIVVRIINNDCYALFFTSNPSWNTRARKATKEELALSGLVYSKPTYLAPVIRHLSDFQISYPIRTIPSYRLDNLWMEFFEGKLLYEKD